MGICQSKDHHHVRMDDNGMLKRKAVIVTGRKRPKELTEVTDSTEADYATAPLSPETAPLTPEAPLRGFGGALHDPFELPVVTSRSQELVVVPKLAKPRDTALLQGRALRARLQKTKNLQLKISLSANLSALADDQSVEASFTGSSSQSSSQKRTLRTPTANPLHHAFGDGAQGNIWAELPVGHEVMAVALSRKQPSLNHTSPSLYLAVGTDQGTVIITELVDDSMPLTTSENMSSRLGKPIEIHIEGKVRTLDFSPSGQFLAVGGDDCICTVFEIIYEQQSSTTEVISAIQVAVEIERVDHVYAVQFSPDGKYLAIGGFDGAVAILSTADLMATQLELVAEITIRGLVLALSWSPDARYLAFGGSDKICSIVNVEESWTAVREVRRPANIVAIQWYPTNSRYLAIASSDVAIVESTHLTVTREIDIPASSTDVSTLQMRVTDICWSPNGSYLVIAAGRQCRLVETKTYAVVQEINRPDMVHAVCWGQQAALAGLPRRYLVLGDDQATTILKAGIEINHGASSMCDDMSSSVHSRFNISTSRGEWVFRENAFKDIEDLATGNPSNPFVRPSNAHVMALAFSRGSKSRSSTYFAYATDDSLVTVLSTIEWRAIAELRFSKPITTMAFASGSRHLAYGCQDGKVYVSETGPNWSLVSTTPLNSPIRQVCWSSDNSLLGVGSADGQFTLLDPKNQFSIVRSMDDDHSPVSALDWSSKFLVIGRQDGSVCFYDTEKINDNLFEPVAEVKRRTEIRSLAFGLNGRFLSVGESDGHVGIYSAKGGWVLCHQWKNSTGGVRSACWSPTGRFLVVGDEHGTLRVMDTVFWASVEEADQSLIRSEEIANASFPMCFSQDGKLVAYAPSYQGAKVVSTAEWKMVFMLTESVDVTDPESSVSSSDDEAVASE